MFAGSAPATPNQVGAIRREFERLGFGEADRPERLRITGHLARAGGQLASTKDLTMGQAGTVVPLLRKAGHRAELEAAAGLPASAPGGPARTGAGRTWPCGRPRRGPCSGQPPQTRGPDRARVPRRGPARDRARITGSGHAGQREQRDRVLAARPPRSGFTQVTCTPRMSSGRNTYAHPHDRSPTHDLRL